MFASKDKQVRGAFKNYAKSTATYLSLSKGLKVYNSKKIAYCQLLMLIIIEFNATMSKLRLLRQR